MGVLWTEFTFTKATFSLLLVSNKRGMPPGGDQGKWADGRATYLIYRKTTL